MQQAVHEATSKAEAELRDAKAAAAAAAELHHQRAAQLNQRCNQLAEQASQLDAALQKQVSSSQQTSAARQQQIQVGKICGPGHTSDTNGQLLCLGLS